MQQTTAFCRGRYLALKVIGTTLTVAQEANTVSLDCICWYKNSCRAVRRMRRAQGRVHEVDLLCCFGLLEPERRVSIEADCYRPFLWRLLRSPF